MLGAVTQTSGGVKSQHLTFDSKGNVSRGPNSHHQYPPQEADSHLILSIFQVIGLSQLG